MVAAFEGWTDAGGAASGAASYLAEHWNAREFAQIESEEYFDFTSLRPQVRIGESGLREIIWPQNRFLAASISGSSDVVFLIGVEPHLRWKNFSNCVTSLAGSLGVQAVFTLGAMLTDVAHTRATPVRASTADERLADRFGGMDPPQYQGPTGIVGVLQDAFTKADIPVGSLMGQVPHYVPRTPSPKATLALVDRVCELLDVHVSTSSLALASSAYEREVSEFVASDDDIAAYVRQLEDRSEDEMSMGLADLPSGDALAAELERFLREQGGSS